MFGLARGMLSPAGGPGDRQFGNMTAGNMTAVVNMNPNGMNPGVMSPGLFGLMDNLVLVAVIIAIVGLVWLGLTIRKSEKMATSQATQMAPLTTRTKRPQELQESRRTRQNTVAQRFDSEQGSCEDCHGAKSRTQSRSWSRV